MTLVLLLAVAAAMIFVTDRCLKSAAPFAAPLVALFGALFWGAVIGYRRGDLIDVVGTSAVIAALYLWYAREDVREGRERQFGAGTRLTPTKRAVFLMNVVAIYVALFAMVALVEGVAYAPFRFLRHLISN